MRAVPRIERRTPITDAVKWGNADIWKPVSVLRTWKEALSQDDRDTQYITHMSTIQTLKILQFGREGGEGYRLLGEANLPQGAIRMEDDACMACYGSIKLRPENLT